MARLEPDLNQNSVVIDVDTSYLAPASRGLSLGHPIVWLAITLGLLALGYVWLSVYAGNTDGPAPTAAVKKLTPEDAARNIAESNVKKEIEMAITRDNDEDRVAEYLAYESIEQQILPLLDAADVQFENEQFVSPEGDNAWESYNAILAIAPDESIAVAGKTKVKSRLIGNAEQAIDNGAYEEAESWLSQLDLIQPEDSFQTNLREEISVLISKDAEKKLLEQKEEEKQQKIETALSQANEELNTDSPNYNKIRDLYGLVSELDPENSAAQDGLESLSDRRLDQVETALRDGDLDAATSGLKAAKAIFPGNKRIGGLQLAIDANLKQKQAREEAEKQRKEEQEEAKKSQVAKTTEPSAKTPDSEVAKKNTQVASSDVSTTVTNALVNQPVLPKAENTAPKIVSGIIGLDKAAKPRVKTESPSLIKGIRAYYNGEYANSFELLYPLAQEGVPRAQFRIGIMYQFGRSVAKNADLAEKWFTAALPELLRQSQQGIAWAQTDLGTAYEFGISLQQDYERAAYWYQKAAIQGYAGAQTNLGVLYAQGDGVPYNRSKAIEWLKKAAAQGDRVANENLNILGVK
ncbi:MAG: sel1 repeat family protein [Acidiferrobacterales bacterium]|nr:sel1 repeat family protein [Acidiferrobacterales bacterium]